MFWETGDGLLYFSEDWMTAEELLIDNGYEGVRYFTDFSYDTAINTIRAIPYMGEGAPTIMYPLLEAS